MDRKEWMRWVFTIVFAAAAVVVMAVSVIAARRARFGQKENEPKAAAEDRLAGLVKNAYIAGADGGTIEICYEGEYFRLPGELAQSYTGVADLEIRDGHIVQVNAKSECVEGVLDSYTDGTVQISGYEVLDYAGTLPVYVLPASGEGQVSQKALKDLVIGTSHVQLVVAGGEACAILQYGEDVYETIRVLLKNGSALTYGKLYLTSDSSYRAGKTKKQKGKVISAEKMLQGCADGEELRVTSENGLLYLCDKDGNRKKDGYEGDFLVRKTGDGYVLINEVPIETYLRYVLPSEMPTYFSYEALKAQAVCARTFAYKMMQGSTYAHYGANLDDSTSFQVYHSSGIYEVTDRAVADTQGLVLTYEGRLIDCYYYSTGSGYSENLEVWGTDSPAYLSAENHTQEKSRDLSSAKAFHEYIHKTPKSYDDASPYYRWVAELSDELGMDDTYGRLKKLTVNKRSTSGYILSLTVTFEEGERTYERENDIRFALSRYLRSLTLADGTVRSLPGSLPSACFEVADKKDGTIRLAGGGFGHGIGLSQYGADGMGRAGAGWQEILAFYFKGTQVVPAR